jgi:membrane protease YdiL (CAAX protease family)
MSQPSNTASPWFVVTTMAFFGAIALFVGFFIGALAYTLVGAPLSLSPTGAAAQLLTSIATYGTMVTIGWLYLLRHELPFSYVRGRLPEVRDLGVTAATVVTLVVLSIAIRLVVDAFGLPIAEHSIGETIQADPMVALAFLPVSILVIGPVEEFLYRGIIQTRLTEVFETARAVGIAAVLFTSIHSIAYFDPGNVSGTIVTLSLLVLPLGAILGAVYEYTNNLVVPALSHGVYNAVVYGLAYVEAVGL